MNSTHNRNKRGKDILRENSREKIILTSSPATLSVRAEPLSSWRSISVNFDLVLAPRYQKAPMIPYKGVTWRALASIHGWFDRCEARCIVSSPSPSVIKAQEWLLFLVDSQKCTNDFSTDSAIRRAATSINRTRIQNTRTTLVSSSILQLPSLIFGIIFAIFRDLSDLYLK